MKRIFSLSLVLCLAFAQIGCAAPASVSPEATSASASDATEQPVACEPGAELGVAITTYDELTAALRDKAIPKAHICASMEIGSFEEQTFEREGFLLTIDKGVTVTIRDNFIPVFFGSENVAGWVNNGTLNIAGTLNFGAMTLKNNGTLEILDGGTLCPGMSQIVNNGILQVEQGGAIRLERGTGLQNHATLINLGEIDVTSDGGSLINSASGILENNGTIVFDGDYQNEGTYTGEQPQP